MEYIPCHYIPYLKANTDLYSSFLDTYDNDEPTNIPVPSGINIQQIYNYLAYIDTQQNPIDNLISGLKLSSLIGDKNYLKYLVNIMLSQWTKYNSILDTTTTNNISNNIIDNKDLLTDIYLHVPYHLLPESHNLDYVFLTTWCKQNQDSTFVVEGNNIYNYDIIYHDNGSLSGIISKRNNIYDGITRKWFSNGILSHTYYCVNGKICGLYEEHHTNGKMRIKYTTLTNGMVIGNSYEWYSNGQLYKECQRRDGYTLYPSKITSWYDNGNMKSQYNYDINGNGHGALIDYNSDGTITCIQHYNTGHIVRSITSGSTQPLITPNPISTLTSTLPL